MSDAGHNVAELLERARAGSPQALGELLETCRAYLLVVAQQELDPALRPKGGASDLVQQTFLEAQRDFEGFRGESEEELLAWLRQALLHNVANFSRGYRQTAKRDIRREIRAPAAAPGTRWQQDLGADSMTPSRHVMHDESAEQLEAALQLLSNDQRQVIIYRYREERSFGEIAERMDRSANAVRKLWLRAIQRLRQVMDNGDSVE